MWTVRPAASDDLPRLAHLWYEKSVLHHQADPRLRLAPDGQARWSRAAADWLTDPQTCVLVARKDADVIAYIVGAVRPGLPGLLPEQVGAITDLAIDTHGYYSGVGRQLHRAACDWLKARGIAQIRIEVARHAAVEQAFWRALGAKEWIDCLWMTC